MRSKAMLSKKTLESHVPVALLKLKKRYTPQPEIVLFVFLMT
jgi:hypothetical protein